jgi:hypothetical protein
MSSRPCLAFGYVHSFSGLLLHKQAVSTLAKVIRTGLDALAGGCGCGCLAVAADGRLRGAVWRRHSGAAQQVARRQRVRPVQPARLGKPRLQGAVSQIDAQQVDCIE